MERLKLVNVLKSTIILGRRVPHVYNTFTKMLQKITMKLLKNGLKRSFPVNFCIEDTTFVKF